MLSAHCSGTDVGTSEPILFSLYLSGQGCWLGREKIYILSISKKNRKRIFQRLSANSDSGAVSSEPGHI